jgi:SNF2 family DNA or RNA helicase
MAFHFFFWNFCVSRGYILCEWLQQFSILRHIWYVLYLLVDESGGTLVVCPASLLNQWEEEVKKRVKRGVIDLEIYHGTSRESRPRQ